MSFVDDLFEYLEEHPGNFAGAAKHFGKKREAIVKVVERFPERLADIEEACLDDAHEQVFLSAKGEARANFRQPEAIKLLSLKRPKEWGGKVTKEEPLAATPPSIVGADYILNGNIIQQHRDRPKQAFVRVEDATGAVLQNLISGGTGRVDTEGKD